MQKTSARIARQPRFSSRRNRAHHIIGRHSKFTNIYAKRGISVNLPRLCEVGLLGTTAGLGFNIFKEPVTQQLGARRTESQNKSYIASESYFGDGGPVTGIHHPSPEEEGLNFAICTAARLFRG